MTPRRGPVTGLALLLAVAVISGVPRLVASADTLPGRLSDSEFWQLSDSMSEPSGFFRSDNLLSNELYYPAVLGPLTARVPQGRVYLGVGPEQNFNYIAAIRPKLVFITDVRRGNLQLQLMYKALFEMSADRADFVSRLFSKSRPPGLTASATPTQIVQAFWDVPTSPKEVFDINLQAIKDHLTKTHTFPLLKEDLDGLEAIYGAFYWYGLVINYNSSNGNGFGRSSMANYAELMVAADDLGQPRSFLASEASYLIIKDLETRNLIVPVVGNFSGPRALRAVGAYVRDHGALVGAFYLSNVEQYLQQDGLWRDFCANVAAMPLDDHSTFIRSQSAGGGTFQNTLGEMQRETRGCVVSAEAVGAR